MKLSTLSTALHHTFLWFFTGSTLVAITGVVSTLYGSSVSSGALAAMMAVVFTTFVPYAIFFWLFFNSIKKQKTIKPTKAWHIWSIVTICIHSISALAWATTLLTSLLIGSETSLIVSSLLAFLLSGVIATAYGLLLLPKINRDKRKLLIVTYLTIIILMIGSLFTLSAINLGSLRKDDQTKQDLVVSAEAIREFTQDSKVLPSNSQAESLLANPDITYKKLSETTYQLCADFAGNYKSNREQTYINEYPMSDEYIYSDYFTPTNNSNQCFEIEASVLSTKEF